MMPLTPAIRIVIADDHPIVRKGIAYSLSPFDDLAVVGQARTGEEALQLCQELQPDVVLMDLKMPGQGGVAAIRSLKESLPKVHTIALTNFREGELVQEAIASGAIGYLLKDVAEEELAKAIRLAYQGVPTLAPAAGQALVVRVANASPPLGHDLTRRERQVLALLVQAHSNQEIADELVIAPPTVKFHIRRIRSKLGTSNRTDTVVLALQHQLAGTSSQRR
jgi:NarL family two-component system response regulator LiaR